MKNLTKILAMTSFLVLLTSITCAQEIIEIKKTGTIEGDDAATAKQKLMDEAIKQVTLENVQAFIGVEKLERSMAVIENKIIKESSKYVLSIRGTQFVRKGNQFQMDTEMKVSLKNLRALLLENGLLYQMGGSPKILPAIQLIDRVNGSSYGWWHQQTGREQQYLAEQLNQLHKSLATEFEKSGFFSLTPVEAQLSQSLPESFRIENLQRADYLFLGDFFKSSVVIRGQIKLQQKMNTENVYVLDARLEALHSGNGRLLAEVTRTYETEAGVFRVVISKKIEEVAKRLAEDIGQQLSDSWRRGTFGASVYKLAVVGKVSPLQIEEFKKLVVLQVNDIKSLRERYFEARKVTFEIDSSVLPHQLAQTFRNTKFNKYKVEVDEVTNEGITINVEAMLQ